MKWFGKRDQTAREMTEHTLRVIRSEQDEEPPVARQERRKKPRRISGPRLVPDDWHEPHQQTVMNDAYRQQQHRAAEDLT